MRCLSAVGCLMASKKKMTPHTNESREGIPTKHGEIAHVTRSVLALLGKPRTRT